MNKRRTSRQPDVTGLVFTGMSHEEIHRQLLLRQSMARHMPPVARAPTKHIKRSRAIGCNRSIDMDLPFNFSLDANGDLRQ